MTKNVQPQSDDSVSIHRLHIKHSVYYAVQNPSEPAPTPPALVIAAHGYGQSCKGFIRNFERWADQNILVVAPQGPHQFYWQQDPPKVGFTWMTRYMRENSIADLMDYMKLLVEDLKANYTFDSSRVFALGFSQGSALAFRFGASGIVHPAGVIACGGDLPPDVAERLNELEPFPVMVVHGKNDTSMSFDKAREGEDILRRHGFPVDTHYFEGSHDLPGDVVDVIGEWIGDRL